MENISPSTSEFQIDDLTWREQEVLTLLAVHLTNKEIGADLHLAESTIKWYNKQIFSKLGVANRKQAVKRAEGLNLLDVSERVAAAEKPQFTNNLPAQLNSFVGRKKEVAEIKKLLNSSRLISITGAGGSGKTRLALQLAKDLADSFRDGVWFVELASLNDPVLVPNEIAKVLKISALGKTPIAELLKRYLSSKDLLLILDNFEHVAAAAPMLAELLASSSKLSILVTSRANLDIYGEQEYSLSPLNLPNFDQIENADLLLDYEAIDLFFQRAKAAQPGLVLNKEEIKSVARICVRLDGLPLAIELAAPLTKIYGLASLAQRLEEDLENLPEGPRNLPERQQTLHATMDWSYQLLNEGDRTLFNRISVFSGGGTLDAIEYVCTDGLSGKLIDRLASLVENNLINPVETKDGELHFTMLETIREYSQERLAAQQDTSAIHRKHASYFTKLAERSDREIRSELNIYWFKRLRTENQNLRSALAWSLEGKEPEFAMRMVGALLYHWYYNGLGVENAHFLDLTLELSASASPALRGAVLLTASFIAYGNSDLEKCRTYLNEANEIFQILGDEKSEGIVLNHLTVASIGLVPDPDKEISYALKALKIFRKLDEKAHMAMSYNVLGEVTRMQGDYKAAKKHYQKSMSLSEETGEIVRQAILSINLAFIAFHEEDFEAAHNINKKGMSLFVKLDSYFGMAVHLASCAGPLAALGFPERAARLLGAANAHQETIGTFQQPADQPEIEAYIKAVQKELGEKAFQEAWLEGEGMTIQEAAAYVLNDEQATD